MKLIFMGTPEFSETILAALAREHAVCAVVTQPDKAVGRSAKLTPTLAKRLAASLGIDVLQPTRLKPPEFTERLKAYGAEAAVVAAYGRVLPQSVLSAFPRGCINVHASLLPKYRGASPIQSAILGGETETGVTIMQMDAGIDTGDILSQRAIPIMPEDTGGSLHEKLAALGAELLLETLARLDAATPAKQDDAAATHTRILTKMDGKIDWAKPARDIANQIRGLNPWPGAFCTLGDDTVKVWRAAIGGAATAPPGAVARADKTGGLAVAAGDGGTVRLLELQAPGGKRLNAADFLNGRRVSVGMTFS